MESRLVNGMKAEFILETDMINYYIDLCRTEYYGRVLVSHNNCSFLATKSILI